MFILVLAMIALVIGLILLFNRLEQVQRKLAHLERQLTLLRDSLGGSTTASQPSAAPLDSPTAGQVTRQRNAESLGKPWLDAEPPSPAAKPKLEKLQLPVPRSRSQQEWESLVGGRLLNRIGALALVIGIGFFLKYAFDNNWISEPVRVLIGIAAGVGVLGLGGYAHRKKYQVFAQGLVGAGVAIFYLSIYAAFNYYHLVSQPVAFGGMIVVTAIAFWQAIWYDAMAIALLGWAGGFLTPFLLASSHPNAVGLFGYLTILNIGILGIVRIRPKWQIVSLLCLVGAYVTYSMSSLSHHWHTVAFEPAMCFLAVTWALFHGFGIYQIKRQDNEQVALGQSALNGLFWILATLILLDSSHHEWEGLTFSAGAIAYAATAYALGWVKRYTTKLLVLCEVFAAALVALATYYFLDPFPHVAMWALEGAAIVWLGLTLQRQTLWRLGMALLTLACFALYIQRGSLHYDDVSAYQFVFNVRAMAYAVLAGSMMISAYLFRRLGQSMESRSFADALGVGWFVVLFGLISVEVSDYFRQRMALETGHTERYNYSRTLSFILLWTVYGAAFMYLAVKRSSRVMVACASVVLTLAALITLTAFTYRPVDEFVLIFNFRVVAFLVLAGGLYLVNKWLSRSALDKSLTAGLTVAAQASLVILLLLLVTAEVWDAYQPAKMELVHFGGNAGRLNRLEDLQQLSLSVAWLVYSMVLMALGLWKRLRMLRLAAILLFFVTILKIFLYDLSFLDTLYRIFSFIGLGVILLAVSYAYQRYKSVIFEEKQAGV